MAIIVSTPQLVQRQASSVVHSFQYPPAAFSTRTLREVSARYIIKRRDAIVWRLLGFEHDVPARHLEQYWNLLDAMMEISVNSAIDVLEEAYCARFRKLQPYEKQQQYPGVQQEVYRIAYVERHKPHEDFTNGTLVEHALDILQEQAYALLHI
jgi:hypothetical protein